MGLKEFYKLICKEFNDGNPLEYKYTEPGGYYRMTKGYTGHGMKEIDAGVWLNMMKSLKRDVEQEHKDDTRSRGRPTKKARNKYVGE